MNREPPLVEKKLPIKATAKILSKKHHAWVVEKKGSKKLVGVITEKDFLEILSPIPNMIYTVGVIEPKSLLHGKFERAEDIMVKNVVKCHPKMTVEEALRLMERHKLRRLAVTENNNIVGELTISDLINSYTSR